MLKILIGFEAVLFASASLVHAGIAFSGFAHRQASIAEGVIAVVLVLGLAVIFVWPEGARTVALVVQAFALLGTLVGAFTMWVGVGPQTTPDRIFHVILLLVLVTGLALTYRTAG